MELLLYKLGDEPPERREVLSVGGALQVTTIKRDGARMYQEHETIHVSATELARIEIIGAQPPPEPEQPPRYRDVAVSPRDFWGAGSDEPEVTLRLRDDEPEPNRRRKAP
jgi:hypothetical protein